MKEYVLSVATLYSNNVFKNGTLMLALIFLDDIMLVLFEELSIGILIVYPNYASCAQSVATRCLD